MSALVADIHAVIWYFFSSPRLSPTARAAMDAAIQAGDPIFVATLSLVEVAYLIEKGRVPAATFERLAQELSDSASRFVPCAFDLLVSKALRMIPRTSSPDMPDPIITATARHLNCPVDHRRPAYPDLGRRGDDLVIALSRRAF
jgi:PIN domain nuclease of toxin-antitoxin system